MDATVALRYAKIRRWIDGAAFLDHFEVQMHAIGHAGIADDPQLLACGHSGLAVGERRRHRTEMAVDADEPGVLHQHFQAARPLVLDADHLARRGGANRRTGRSRQIDTVMIGASPGVIGQHARTERRGDAG